MAKHHEELAPFGVHQVAFVSETDPATDPDNLVSKRKIWIETDDDVTPTAVTSIRIRNEANNAWIKVADGAAAGEFANFIAKAIFDAKGDLLTATADNTPARLAAGSDGKRLKALASQATGLIWVDEVCALPIVIGNGSDPITTGLKGYIEIPFACILTASRLFGNQSGSIVIDIWKDTYANFPPVDADSITASAPPTLSSAQKSQDTTLTGWTTAIAAGDILGFNVDSVTDLLQVTLSLTLRKS